MERRWLWLMAAGLGLLAAGCETGGGGAARPGAGPAGGGGGAQPELARRAMDLLERAAESELDVVRCNAIEALVQVAPQRGQPYFRAALKANEGMVRFAGCIAVGDVKDTAAREGVQRCLQDNEMRVRLGAAYAAYRLGDAGAAQLLVNMLSDSPDENLRSDAAYLIGRLKEQRAIKRLETAVKDKSNKVSIHALIALAMLGQREAVDRLIDYAQGDTVSRVLALQGLCELADERARDALLYRMSENEDYLEVRLVAARGLGRLKSNAGYALAMQNTSYSAQDATDQMRIRSLAALALGSIGDARALPALRKLAESQDDARVQVAAAFAICQISGMAK